LLPVVTRKQLAYLSDVPLASSLAARGRCR
jgi:hypothetical protein